MTNYLHLVLKTGEINFRCMELLDHANSGIYGNWYRQSSSDHRKGPFIVVSGHDLHDMELLLKADGRKRNQYLHHSGMLPAIRISGIKEIFSFKETLELPGRVSSRNFTNIPAPIYLLPTCLMPVRQSYCDRVFYHLHRVHIRIWCISERTKISLQLLRKLWKCKGYPEDHPMTGINGGSTVTTGFAHNAVLSNAGHIVELIKVHKIRSYLSGRRMLTVPLRAAAIIPRISPKAAPMDTLIPDSCLRKIPVE